MTHPSHIARKWQSMEKKPGLLNPSPIPYPLAPQPLGGQIKMVIQMTQLYRVRCLKQLGLKTLLNQYTCPSTSPEPEIRKKKLDFLVMSL